MTTKPRMLSPYVLLIERLGLNFDRLATGEIDYLVSRICAAQGALAPHLTADAGRVARSTSAAAMRDYGALAEGDDMLTALMLLLDTESDRRRAAERRAVRTARQVVIEGIEETVAAACAHADATCARIDETFAAYDEAKRQAGN